MKKRPNSNLVNKKARFDYDLKESYQAGIMLNGPEASSVRAGKVTMRGAFVTIKNNEAWLNNLEIGALPTNAAHMQADITRARKLLIKQREIDELKQAKDSGLSVVPTKLIKGRYIKIEIAIARGKKKYDKRATLKKRDQDREIARQMSRRN